MNRKKIFATILILTLVFFLSTSALFSQCRLTDTKAGKELSEEGKSATGEEAEEETPGGEEELKNGEYYIAYFEVGSAENSMHFEHRLANVIAISHDGTDERPIYTDLIEKYDLSEIYGISPDTSKISCGFCEGGRGAYSSLCIIDVATGDLDTIVKFDYTQTESMELMADIYDKPIWSHSGEKIAYETIYDPYTNNFKNGGISIADINTGDIQAVDLDMEGASLGSTTFLVPVLFSGDDSRLFNIVQSFNTKVEDGNVLGYFTRNEKLVAVDISSGEINTILDADEFEGSEVSFDNFNLLTRQDKFVFQVLGDFEEDGDIWISDINGGNLSRLTSNTDLREQQPTILDLPDTVGKLAYTGVKRYGTIPDQLSSGDIYIMNMDGSELVKITDNEIGAAKPVFSPDGKYLAFIHYIYDSNMEYVKSRQIEVYDMESGETKTIVSSSNILDLIGWIRVES
jgi:hypothetical protein